MRTTGTSKQQIILTEFGSVDNLDKIHLLHQKIQQLCMSANYDITTISMSSGPTRS